MDDIIVNKVDSIEKCIRRINEEAAKDWKKNYTIQDALILNLERACQASIDMAAHVVKKKKLGIPKFSRELFDLMVEEELITPEVGKGLKKMVGFRNIAVHDYGNIDLTIVSSILTQDLWLFQKYCEQMLSLKD